MQFTYLAEILKNRLTPEELDTFVHVFDEQNLDHPDSSDPLVEDYRTTMMELRHYLMDRSDHVQRIRHLFTLIRDARDRTTLPLCLEELQVWIHAMVAQFPELRDPLS